MTICIILCVSEFIYKISHTGNLKYSKNFVLAMGGFFITTLISSIFHNNMLTTINFIWIYAFIFLIYKSEIQEKYLNIICNIYGVLGVSVLYLFNYTNLLSGWNANTISMLGMYSYLFFLLPHYGKRDFYKKTYVLLVSIFYFLILVGTDSRAAILFSVVAFLLSMFNVQNKLVNKDNIDFYILIPFIVALFVIFVSNTMFFETLDTWSLDKFDKPIFNGRDILWEKGFEVLGLNILFGCGDILKANWHNSAITLLASYGVLGYITWFQSLKYLLIKSTCIKYDRIVCGSLTMFFVMFVHQSVELGFITAKPNLLPYIMLGIVLSRTKSLERVRKDGK